MEFHGPIGLKLTTGRPLLNWRLGLAMVVACAVALTVACQAGQGGTARMKAPTAGELREAQVIETQAFKDVDDHDKLGEEMKAMIRQKPEAARLACKLLERGERNAQAARKKLEEKIAVHNQWQFERANHAGYKKEIEEWTAALPRAQRESLQASDITFVEEHAWAQEQVQKKAHIEVSLEVMRETRKQINAVLALAH